MQMRSASDLSAPGFSGSSRESHDLTHASRRLLREPQIFKKARRARGNALSVAVDSFNLVDCRGAADFIGYYQQWFLNWTVASRNHNQPFRT